MAHSPDAFRSNCPLASALDLLGDRWTLLVLRDLTMGRKKRFAELQQTPEGIPTNLLADRLRKLEAAGLVSKTPYQHAPVRYEYQPTLRAIDLLPAIRELVAWANRHLPDTGCAPPGFFDQLAESWRAELGEDSP
jgi:DNA-binding HxlR family transcriptional regulator